MTFFSLLAVLALAIVLVVLVVGLPFALVRNMAQGAQFRRDLDQRVRGLRLSTMLDYLGIDRARYLHQESVVSIHKHMRRCADCEATDACDQVIGTPGPAESSIDFCPNADSLTKTP